VAHKPESDDPARGMADAIDEHLAEPFDTDRSANAQSSPGESDADVRKKAAERDEYLNLLQRSRAEFANYQKRVQKEVEATRRFASQPVVTDLLGGLDNLERALAAADATTNPHSLLDGVRMVHQQLVDALSRHGVRAIEAVGKPFDPEFHEALLEQSAPDKPARTVLQELQKGYCLHDRVIRPAKVVVSKADGAAANPPEK
jgi:molecular chaperone GrpE